MGVLQDFERRLEGAVEGFFTRAFRSGLQPVELAKAIQRYAEDNRHVTTDGVVVPNDFRVTISERDQERLATFGDQLARELAQVVVDTARERTWKLRGPARVRVHVGAVRRGRYELTGRVAATSSQPRVAAPPPRPSAPPATPVPSPSPRPAAPSAAPPAPAAADAAETTVLSGQRASARLVTSDGRQTALTGPRITIGRLDECDVVLDDSTVSRHHAAIVRRGDTWWLLDLGSTNGTRVNDVQAAEQPLRDGDEIEVGDARLTFRGS